MSKIGIGLAVLFLPLLSLAGAAQDAAKPASDWTSWGYDQERTGWNRGETTLTKANVSKLKLLWSTQLSTPPRDVVLSTLTAPVVVAGVETSQGTKNLVLLLGADDTLFALDADGGKILWQKTYPNPVPPGRPATWLCANTAQDTPVVDRRRGVVYLIASDGKLRAVNLADGADRMAPTQFIAPFSRAWSLNLIDDVVYTSNARSCGTLTDPAMAAASQGAANGAARLEPGSVAAMDVSDPAHPVVTRFYTSGGRQSGPWGRGGVARTPRGIVTQTADGLYDPAAGAFGDTLLALAPRAARLMDSFTPANQKYLLARDLDFSSGSPIVFAFAGKTVIATAGKEGVLYLLDADNVGGGAADHSAYLYKSPLLGNDEALGTQPGQGMWGAMATYEADGKRFLYMPMWGPPSKTAPAFKTGSGPIPHGSIMAFQLAEDRGKISAVPLWTSPDMTVPDAPVVANGVVYAVQTGEQTLQAIPAVPGQSRQPANPSTNGATFRATPVSNLILYALDAETGRTLYSSKKIVTGWTHFSEPVVALGKVFVVTHDARLYAFGLK